MKNTLSFLLVILSLLPVVAQNETELNVAVDTTRVMIGAQLNYTLQVKADSTAQVVFPERAIFAPFEILEESPIDTIRAQTHYLFTKRYALIQFDSGRYALPQQQVFINGFSKIADSIGIEVVNVVVDTLKQNLYDIKPLKEVDKNYDALIAQILWGLVGLFVLIGILYTYFFQKRRKELRNKEIAPFDRAIGALKELETESPSDQQEYKAYYSRLTDVVRRYLEDEAKISALESTSEELLFKLEALKEGGKLELETATLKSLKTVLQTADLVKFAKELPQFGIASNDRKAVEVVVIETKEALPEPTEEELRQQAAYQAILAKKRRRERMIWGAAGGVILALLTLVSSMAFYGYYPVRDTLLRYPTKQLYSGQWVESQYGTPPLKITTPEVLERIPGLEENEFHFMYGNFDKAFYIDVHFNMQSPKKGAPSSPQQSDQNEVDNKGQELINAIIANFESKGAVNILIKDDQITLPSSIEVLKIYGTLDYPRKGKSERVRSNYTTLLFAFKEGTISVTMMYSKDDRYGSQIEERIINSLDLIKEL